MKQHSALALPALLTLALALSACNNGTTATPNPSPAPSGDDTIGGIIQNWPGKAGTVRYNDGSTSPQGLDLSVPVGADGRFSLTLPAPPAALRIGLTPPDPACALTAGTPSALRLYWAQEPLQVQEQDGTFRLFEVPQDEALALGEYPARSVVRAYTDAAGSAHSTVNCVGNITTFDLDLHAGWNRMQMEADLATNAVTFRSVPASLATKLVVFRPKSVPVPPAPTPPPGPTPAPAPLSGAWVMGYAVGYERDLLPLDGLNWASLTHIAVGRATPNADGTLNTSFDIDAVNGPVWAKNVVQQAHAHGVKAILMLGGAGERDGFVGAASATHRAAFVQNILNVVRTSGFDGVDLDWEPLEPQDEAPLKALAQSLKAGQPGLLLTLPVNFVNANDPAAEARPSLAALAGNFDRINIMSYGMAGVYPGWKSWHASALAGDTDSTPSSVQSSVKAYLAAGIPAGKLGVGIGFYGLCYQGVTAPGQSSASMRIVADDGDMSYANIMGGYFKASARKWDGSAQVPYLSSGTPLGGKGCTFLSYEDAQSIAAKGQYARSLGLGGTIIWTLAQGHVGGADPLLDAVKAAFRP